ncbi:MAG: ATP-binding protein, partial [Candidatus Omnitrophica bacterium]|nr:ATP-binding protein [Candidatus Omnitrophota bacterium]
LISNAIKFTDEGSISVSTHLDNEYIRVSVSDTGPGIKEDDVSNLFKKFIQLEGGMERKHAGTGLGLVICKYMIENHRGRIWAESNSGKGVTFHFALPIVKMEGTKDG